MMPNTARRRTPLAWQVSLACVLTATSFQSARAANGTWTRLVGGDASGLWSDSSSWAGGIIANGATFTANFATLDLTLPSTIQLFRVDQSVAAYRPGHRTGNWMLTSFLSAVFGQAFKDILSGYRVFSRRFVKSFPVLSDGFEIETELSVHALELALPVVEIETPYYARPEGSFSKLNTWGDGFRILGTILKLYRSEKPLRFFTVIGMFLMLVSIGLAIPVIITFLEEGLVPRLPTAVLSMGLMIVAVLSVSSGLVLDTVTRGRREMKLLAYLSQPAIKRD